MKTLTRRSLLASSIATVGSTMIGCEFKGNGAGVQTDSSGVAWSKSTDPVIIEVCLNGGTPKSINPNVPRTPEEVAEDALECVEAGATILHSHTNDAVIGGGTGRHDPEPLIRAWSPVIERYPDVLFYPTMQGGGGDTSIEARASHMQDLIDANLMRLALIDMGTSNMSFLGKNGLPGNSDALFIKGVLLSKCIFCWFWL